MAVKCLPSPRRKAPSLQVSLHLSPSSCGFFCCKCPVGRLNFVRTCFPSACGSFGVSRRQAASSKEPGRPLSYSPAFFSRLRRKLQHQRIRFEAVVKKTLAVKACITHTSPLSSAFFTLSSFFSSFHLLVGIKCICAHPTSSTNGHDDFHRDKKKSISRQFLPRRLSICNYSSFSQLN